MFTCALQSGSNGNCIYVETPDARLLFDAGISAQCAGKRLADHGRDITKVDALLISHNHSDHVRSAGIFQRKFGHPLYITAGAWQKCRTRLAPVCDVRHFEPGEQLRFGSTSVETVATAHDSVDGVAFVVGDEFTRLGIFTDLGHRFDGLEDWIGSLDAVYLESNYDPQMLADGPYPPWLKRRITGSGGHLSNIEAARLVLDCGRQLKLLILSHLSEHNNHPDVALETARELLGPELPIVLAPRTAVSEMFCLPYAR